MRGEFVIVIAFCLSFVCCHEWMAFPEPRTKGCVLNGLIMGDMCDGGQCSQRSRPFWLNYNDVYENFACSGNPSLAIDQTSTQYCYWSTWDDEDRQTMFNMSVQQPVTASFVAGSEYQIQIIGFLHPGVMRIAVCYENCNSMRNFEDYILGYWFWEGTAGPNANIYSAMVNLTVKMPNRNCDNCVLQMLLDADDVRSYVNCADISITGASGDNSLTWCNGHPFCNCDLVDPLPPFFGKYGLGYSCPYSYSGDTYYENTDFISQLGTTEYCGYCASNGCPVTCGGIWQGVYTGPNEKGGTHTNNLPQYVECSKSNPCSCPSCKATYTPSFSGPQ